MPALADLQWAAENAKGWLKLSPRTCQLSTFLYNPQLLCTTMLYKAVLSSGKTGLFIQNVTSQSPPNHYDSWNNQVTQIYEAVWLLPLLAWLVSWEWGSYCLHWHPMSRDYKYLRNAMFPYTVKSVWWHNEYVLIRLQYIYIYIYIYLYVCVCVWV